MNKDTSERRRMSEKRLSESCGGSHCLEAFAMYEDEYEEYIINEILAEYEKVYPLQSEYLGFDQ